MLDLRTGDQPYGVDEYIHHGIEESFSSIPVGEGDTALVRVCGGLCKVATRTKICRVKWKHWTKISKSNVIDVGVDLFWALQLQEHANVTEMYEMVSQISSGTLQDSAGTG